MTLLCQWLIKARQCISLKVTVKLIKKCIGQVRSQYVMEYSEEAGNFSSKCEELESIDCSAAQFKNNQGGESDTDWKKQMDSDMFCVLTI